MVVKWSKVILTNRTMSFANWTSFSMILQRSFLKLLGEVDGVQHGFWKVTLSLDWFVYSSCDWMFHEDGTLSLVSIFYQWLALVDNVNTNWSEIFWSSACIFRIASNVNTNWSEIVWSSTCIFRIAGILPPFIKGYSRSFYYIFFLIYLLLQVKQVILNGVFRFKLFPYG